MKTETESCMKMIETRLADLLAMGRTIVYEHEVYELLAALGYRTPRSLFAASEEDLKALDLSIIPGDEVVCKLISPRMAHRFEYGGVRFTRKTKPHLEGIFRDFLRISARHRIDFAGMMIAEKIEGSDAIQNQLLLSLRQDISFGPVVFIGLGGVGTEVYKQYIKEGQDLVIRAASEVHDHDGTERALQGTLFYPILRGKTRITPDPLIDGRKVHEVLASFALLAESFSPLSPGSPVTIEELEVNPIQITPGGEFVPLDALMNISRNKIEPLYPHQSGIRSLLNPDSALIIGASASKMNAGRIILRNIIEAGKIPRTSIFLLHPEAAEIEGCRAYKSIDEVPGQVDMTVFTIPANERSARILEELIDKEKTRSITLIPGGFGETEKGKELDERIKEAIHRSRRKNRDSVVVNGPNCLGIVSKPGGYNTFFIPKYKLPFRGKYGENSAIISQSGAYLVTLVSNMAELLSPKYMITYGNQMDLTVTDYLIHLGNDPGIDLFCIYLEGFKPYDGQRFLRVAREIIGSGKRIIIYKTGRTKAGAAAVASHTASMAGNYEVLNRLLADAGVIMPDTLSEMEDAIKVFTLLSGKRVTGTNIGVLANAGFECSVAADRLYSMKLARFAPDTIERLHEALPTDIIDVNNPVDATPLTNAVDYGRCLEAMMDDGGVDCIVAANVAPTPFMETLPAGPGHGEDIRNGDSYPNVTIRVFRATRKPMVVSLDSGRLFDPAVEMMEEAGLPCFRKIDRAMKALDLFLRHGGTT